MILIVEGPYEVRWGDRLIQNIVIWTAAGCMQTDIDCFVKLPFVPEFNDSGDDCRALSRSNQAPWAIAVIADPLHPKHGQDRSDKDTNPDYQVPSVRFGHGFIGPQSVLRLHVTHVTDVVNRLLRQRNPGASDLFGLSRPPPRGYPIVRDCHPFDGIALMGVQAYYPQRLITKAWPYTV